MVQTTGTYPRACCSFRRISLFCVGCVALTAMFPLPWYFYRHLYLGIFFDILEYQHMVRDLDARYRIVQYSLVLASRTTI